MTATDPSNRRPALGTIMAEPGSTRCVYRGTELFGPHDEGWFALDTNTLVVDVSGYVVIRKGWGKS